MNPLTRAPLRVYNFCLVCSIDQISTTVVGVLSEYLKSNERTIFWDDNLKANVDPFAGVDSGFFTADWDLKVCITGLSPFTQAIGLNPYFVYS